MTFPALPPAYAVASVFSSAPPTRENRLSIRRERTFPARLKSMAFYTRDHSARARASRCPIIHGWGNDARSIFVSGKRTRGERKSRLRKSDRVSYVLRSSDHFSNSSETWIMSLSRALLSYSPPTISSPLKLNSRSIRPQGRFCSNGSEINVSFKRSRSPRDRWSYTLK